MRISALALLIAVALLASPQAKKPAPKTTSKKEVAAQKPATPARLMHLGVAYMNQQRLEQALDFFRRAAATPGEHVSTARLNAGIALLNLQRNDDALPLLQGATEALPHNPRAWFNLGLLHRNTGDAPKAIAAFQKASELDPADPDTHYFLGMMHSQAQDYPAAIQSFERAIELNPTHVSAEFGLARTLQRSGRAEEARTHLARFEQLNQSKVGAPISLIYGEQGKYSTVEEWAGAEQKAGEEIAVKFVPAPLIRAAAPSARRTDPPTPADAEIESLGPGACFLDYDNDGRQDLLLGRSDAGFALFRNTAAGFVNVTIATGVRTGKVSLGCTAADYDNDGHIDFAVTTSAGVQLFRNSGKGKFSDATKTAGIAAPAAAFGLGFVDYDHDGDVDLFIGVRDDDATTQLWRNNGNGAFTDVSAATGLARRETTAAVLTDFNNDRAVDLVTTGEHTRILVNPREGEFKEFAPWSGPESKSPPDTAGVAVADFDRDGWMDLAFTHAHMGGISIWRNEQGKSFKPIQIALNCLGQSFGIAAFDYDNDGWMDLLYARTCENGSQLRLLRNTGGAFKDVSAAALAAVKVAHPRAVITADYDNDGDRDVLVSQAESAPLLLRNDGGNKRASLRVQLRGLNDNKSGIGTKVEVIAGANRQKLEVQSSSGYLGQSALPVQIGLGGEARADVVRMLWPTGVLQDEIDVLAGKTHTIDAIDRRGSSCPVLFAWNGQQFEFITDVIGAGIVGHWVAPGERNTADPDEYVKIGGASLQPRNGRLSLRFIEPMEEVVFLDQVRLVAVDHPADVDVYPFEHFAGAPPFPQFRIVASRAPQPAAAATSGGKDVLPLLLHRDRRYADNFRLTKYKGFTEPHTLELELPQPYAGGPLRLLMHGFTDYFTATSVYAAHQGGVSAVVPHVDAQLPDGTWQRASDNIGFPAGLLRTMTADLTGTLPPGTRRIRIGTNLKIHWDQILFDTTPAESEKSIRMTEAPLAHADLAFRGYPRQVDHRTRGDVSYDYQRVSRTGPYARHAGAYTRYGDVLPLLRQIEDRFVIIGSGDEVALEFDATALPPLPAGWTRDYFFFAHGYSKDMDFYEAHSATVEPLPWGRMPGYPYPASRPPDGGYPEYRLDWNTRHESGNAMRGLRFDYRPVP